MRPSSGAPVAIIAAGDLRLTWCGRRAAPAGCGGVISAATVTAKIVERGVIGQNWHQPIDDVAGVGFSVM